MCQALPARKQPHTVFVDEAQNVPAVFDAVQALFDADKNRWRFILCGSSARKLRKTGANLLPGRSFIHHLYPLILAEQPPPTQPPAYAASPLALPWKTPEAHRTFPAWDIEERLAYGALPGVVTADTKTARNCFAHTRSRSLKRRSGERRWLRTGGPSSVSSNLQPVSRAKC